MITVIFATGIAVTYKNAKIIKNHPDGSIWIYKEQSMNSDDWIATVPAATNCIVCDSAAPAVVVDLVKQKLSIRTCRVCGCNDLDCTQCIEKTGRPCTWVEEDLCSACVNTAREKPVKRNKKAAV